MPTFRILRHTHPPVIQCEACLEEVHYWDDRAASRWKAAHNVNCPRDYGTTRSTS